MNLERKHYVIGAVALLVAGGLAYQLNSETTNNTTSDWKQIELEDVRNGETYTVAELDKPVIVETFAVWCPTCTRQQEAVKTFKENSDVESISLDVDPEETPEKIRSHIERQGFDWRYSVAPPEMSRALAQEYGNVMLNPPSAPMVLVCENGTRLLPTGVKPASQIQEEVNKGC